jgi:hypothetical protein
MATISSRYFTVFGPDLALLRDPAVHRHAQQLGDLALFFDDHLRKWAAVLITANVRCY